MVDFLSTNVEEITCETFWTKDANCAYVVSWWIVVVVSSALNIGSWSLVYYASWAFYIYQWRLAEYGIRTAGKIVQKWKSIDNPNYCHVGYEWIREEDNETVSGCYSLKQHSDTINIGDPVKIMYDPKYSSNWERLPLPPIGRRYAMCIFILFIWCPFCFLFAFGAWQYVDIEDLEITVGLTAVFSIIGIVLFAVIYSWNYNRKYRIKLKRDDISEIEVAY